MWQAGFHVASGLARVGLRSSPNSPTAFFQTDHGAWFEGRFAPQRGQARSPHKPARHNNTARHSKPVATL